MPIRSFVDEKLFAPELIESMAVAFNGTCASLGLVDKSDKATEVVRDAANEFWNDPKWHDMVLGEPVVAGVENIELDHLQLRVIARTLPGKQFDVGRALRLKLALALQRAGIAEEVAAHE